MSATDHTIKLGLPLFRDDDKPTWRGDINDMSQRVDDGYARLETDISTAQNTAATAMNLATAANETVTETATNIATQIATDSAAEVQTDINSVRSDMDAFIAAHENDGELPTLDAVNDIGLRADGSADCGEPLRLYMENHPEGGVIIFPTGTYLFSTALITAKGRVTGPWRLQGMGCRDFATDDDPEGATDDHITVTGGTIFKNSVRTGSGMLILGGDARFVVDSVAFETDIINAVPHVDIETAIVNIRNCSFRGAISAYHNSNQVGVSCGTSGVYTYGGYGSCIRDCQFDRVGVAVRLYNGANGFRIDNIVGSSKCGQNTTHSAFITMDGTGGILKQCLITNVICESHAFHHVVSLKNVDKNTFINVQGWDNSWMTPQRFESGFYLSDGVTNNTIITPLIEGTMYTTNDNKNTYALTRGNKFIGPGWVSATFVKSTDTPPYPTIGLDVNDGKVMKIWDGETWVSSTFA